MFNWLRRKPTQAAPAAPPEAPKPRREPRISDVALAISRRTRKPEYKPFALDEKKLHPPGVGRGANGGMAMDDGLMGPVGWAGQAAIASAFMEGQAFLGYPELALLAQRTEYRRVSQVFAFHMTRRWIRLTTKGDEDKSDKIKAIEADLTRLGVRPSFRRVAEQDGQFGRGHLFLDFGDNDNPAELQQSVGNGRDATSRAKVTPEHRLQRVQPVEAVWCYPQRYNSTQPLEADWYKPATWYAMNLAVDATRLLTFIAREVPDLLKPAYSFGGLSLSQMVKPYVENWLRVRQGVTDIVTAFSVFVLKTNVTASLTDSSDTLFQRAEIFNNYRSNSGLLLVDKENEDFDNVSAPLSGLEALQAQAQEHIPSAVGIPLVEYCGIQPAGLNASSEGELKTFYATVHSLQEAVYRPNLTSILGFVQLGLFGEIDPDIDFEFEPLEPMNDKERAEIQLIHAQTDAAYTDAGVLSAETVRKRIAADDDSIYQGVDLSEAVPLPPGVGEPSAPGQQTPPQPPAV